MKLKRLIGWAMVYKTSSSFVIVDDAFYHDKDEILEEAKEVAQALKKKVLIKKVYYTVDI
jgi:transaldolase